MKSPIARAAALLMGIALLLVIFMGISGRESESWLTYGIRKTTSNAESTLSSTTNSNETIEFADDSEFYYYYHNERIQIRLVPDRLAIRFAPDVTEQEKRTLLRNSDMELVSQIGDFELYFCRLKSNALSKSDLQETSSIEQVIEIFVWEDGTMFLIPNQFFVQFKEPVSEAEIVALNKQYGVTIVEKNEWLGNNYLLEVSDQATRTALELANLYHESPLTEYAEPEFITFSGSP